MINRRKFLKITGAAGAGSILAAKMRYMKALASVNTAQSPLLGKTIPKYVDPLPTFVGARVTGTDISVSMHEFQQPVLPESFYAALPAAYQKGTWVWGYKVGGMGPLYPGFTIEAKKGTTTYVSYSNNLPVTPELQKYLTIDQTLHWANPDDLEMDDPLRFDPYGGPPPVVPHLHGGMISSYYDGGPDSWWTPNGKYGGAYQGNPYEYLNDQEAATLWFHDHTLGATRINVYAGLAAFYLLRDDRDTGQVDNPLHLPAGDYEIEIAIQDRQFDTNGQWLFPDGTPAGFNGPPPNPTIHPFWNPEFFGDVIVVNGKSWPYLDVEPRRYRFRMLDGSNARFYDLRLENLAAKTLGPAFWMIGTDGGFLDMPAKLNDPTVNKPPRMLFAPGERYDVIIDFAGYEGQTLTLVNKAKAPYPAGVNSDPQTNGQVMQFRVGTTVTNGPDTSYNPATDGTLREQPIITLNAPSKTRQLVLVEVEGVGGPIEVLVNNTKWSGKRPDAEGNLEPVDDTWVVDGRDNYLSETPAVGSTEQWQIINTTMDAHPIHLHLVQFQLVSRQQYQAKKYRGVYDAAFPGGTFDGITYAPGLFIPAYGPPADYNTQNAAGAVGGNPDITPYLQGPARGPNPEERGWKDTVIMYPGEVTTINVQFTKQDGTSFAFDATEGPGYVWHCHIIDHEDNEMMRPYIPIAPG
jgi:spore coat protein A